MSDFDRFKWFNQFIDDERVDDPTVALLAVLMRFMGKHGTCHPSNATIANRLGRSEDTVRRRVRAAEKLGYITTTQTPGLGKSYTAITPSVDATPGSNATPSTGATSTDATPRTTATPPPARVQPHPSQPCRETPGTGATLTEQPTDKITAKEEEGPSSPPKSDPVELNVSRPFTHPQTEEALSYDELLNIRHPEHLIRALADHFKIPVAAGTEMVIWSRTKDEIGNEQKARKYIGAKMTSLGAGDEAARRKYSPRGVMEWIPGDAKKWLKSEEMPKQELQKRGDVRNTSFMDTELAKRFT